MDNQNKINKKNENKVDELVCKQEASFTGLIPLIVFVLLFVTVGIILDIFKNNIYSNTIYHQQAEIGGFYLIPASIIILVAVIFGFLIIKGTFNMKLAAFLKGSTDENIIIMIFIYLLSGAFINLMKTIGGSLAVAFLSFKVIPATILVVAVFIISAIIATSMGASVGTIVTFGPIVFPMAHESGVPLAMVAGALLCGAMLGDNLSLISDTAIASCKTQDVLPKDRFLYNWKILLIPTIIAIICFLTLAYAKNASSNTKIWKNSWKAMITILPFIIVLTWALLGVNVFIVLIIGIIASLIVGFSLNQFGYWKLPTSSEPTTLFAPDLLPHTFANKQNASALDNFLVATNAIKNGMFDMADTAFLALLTGGLAGLSNLSGGITWLINKINRNIKGPRSAQFGIASLTTISDVALANNTIAIIITGPIVKQIRQQHKLDKNKVAALLSIFPNIFQGLLPYGAQMLLLVASANKVAANNQISFLDVWKYSWYLYLLLITTVILIIFPKLEKVVNYRIYHNLFKNKQQILD